MEGGEGEIFAGVGTYSKQKESLFLRIVLNSWWNYTVMIFLYTLFRALPILAGAFMSVSYMFRENYTL